MTAIELTDELKTAISWTITMINAFVMFTSGLVIDIKALWGFFKVHFKWAVLIGLLCQFGMMPFLAFGFSNILTDAQSIAVIIQGTCPGSAILNLFSAWCAGNRLLAQTLTSVATASAIALMPFFLFIYSNAILDEEKCLKEYNGPCPEIPYFPIMRTLSILIASLIIGILVKWRFKRNKIIKKISKLGTILGFLVIMTFIVLALLIYEEAWLVSRNMWISAIFIPMLGYILGFLIAWGGRTLLQILVVKFHFKFIDPEALVQFDWAEVRTIGLACGLQNCQLGMSTVFGAYSLSEEVFLQMHPYSPLYGVFELLYAFIIAAVFFLMEKYYWRVSKPAGPRFPNVNIEEDPNYTKTLETFLPDDVENQLGPSDIKDLLKRLPQGFVRRFGVESDTYDDMDDSEAYRTLHSLTSFVQNTLHTSEDPSPEAQQALEDLQYMNTLTLHRRSSPPTSEIRQRNISLQELFQRAASAEISASQVSTSRQTSINERHPSHVADFSQTLPRQNSGSGEPTGRFLATALIENDTEETLVAPLSPRSFEGTSTSSAFDIFLPGDQQDHLPNRQNNKNLSRNRALTITNEPVKNSTITQKPSLQTQISMPNMKITNETAPKTPGVLQRGRFNISVKKDAIVKQLKRFGSSISSFFSLPEQKEIPNIADRRGTIMTIVPDFEDDDVFEASNEKNKSNESIFNERLSNLPENFEKVRPSIGIKLERISSSGSLEDEESSTENRSSETEPVSISREIALEKDSCKNSKTNVKNDSSTESIDSALGSNSPSSTKSITKVS